MLLLVPRPHVHLLLQLPDQARHRLHLLHRLQHRLLRLHHLLRQHGAHPAAQVLQQAPPAPAPCQEEARRQLPLLRLPLRGGACLLRRPAGDQTSYCVYHQGRTAEPMQGQH